MHGDLFDSFHFLLVDIRETTLPQCHVPGGRNQYMSPSQEPIYLGVQLTWR